MAAGAECVCVAEIRIRSVGMPVFSRASSLARSSSSRGIMQLSTTTIASRIDPSSRTRLLARIGSLSRLALFCRNPPLTSTGNGAGVTSIAQAPARNSFGSAGFAAPCWCASSDGHAWLENTSIRYARTRWMKVLMTFEGPLVPVNDCFDQVSHGRERPSRPAGHPFRALRCEPVENWTSA